MIVLRGSPCCLSAGHDGEHSAKLGHKFAPGDCGFTGVIRELGPEGKVRKHCWHDTQIAECPFGNKLAKTLHTVSVCCWCGERWCEHRVRNTRIAGHGPNHPEIGVEPVPRDAEGPCQGDGWKRAGDL